MGVWQAPWQQGGALVDTGQEGSAGWLGEAGHGGALCLLLRDAWLGPSSARAGDGGVSSTAGYATGCPNSPLGLSSRGQQHRSLFRSA